MPELVDCSAVSDHHLSQHLNGLWQFPHAIKYSFGGDLGLYEALSMPPTLRPPYHSTQKFTQIARGAMQYWQQFSGGLLKFEEVPSLSSGQSGILLTSCGSQEQFNQYAPNTLGMAKYWLWDDSQYFRRVIVCFPEGAIEGQSAESNKTLHHEIFHALGAGHFHEGETGEVLRNTVYGQACSVMPYEHLIRSAKSDCPVDICPVGYATAPGPLDKRFLNLAYDPKAGWLPTINAQQQMLEVQNTESSLVCLGLIMFSASVIKEVLQHYCVDRQYGPENKTSHKDRYVAQALVGFSVDLWIVLVAQCAGVVRREDGLFLAAFLIMRAAASGLQLCENKKLKKMAGAIKSDYLWHGFFGLMAAGKHLSLGGVAELANGLAHVCVNYVGANALGGVQGLFGKSKQPEPLLPLFAPHKSPRRAM
ncbi:MAG: hypothetical protein P1U63_12935 [Coxiellaceae bacterium]|nr:hypothetical protein [Coxiellaceae bacterium]